MMRISRVVALALIGIGTPVLAAPTEVTVRVIARDAKFIGQSMGSARVTLRNAKSGKILAQGLTQGSTGETDRIMKASGRSPIRSSEGVAAFAASIDIDRPTLVVLEAEGPLGHPGSALKTSQQRWILPGKPVTQGEGWTIELPGLVITPQVKVAAGKAAISAKIELMCGCPITPGGQWDAAEYQVQATLWQAGKQIAASDLAFMTSPGGYAGEIALPSKRRYTLGLYALNTRTGNSGYIEVPVQAD
jgi:hypothetical protein